MHNINIYFIELHKSVHGSEIKSYLQWQIHNKAGLVGGGKLS